MELVKLLVHPYSDGIFLYSGLLGKLGSNKKQNTTYASAMWRESC